MPASTRRRLIGLAVAGVAAVVIGRPAIAAIDLVLAQKSWRLADLRIPGGDGLLKEYKKLNADARAAGMG